MMPYYEETFLNEARPQRHVDHVSGVVTNSLMVTESAKVMSYRTRPHPRAIGDSLPLLDSVADPYAHFLTNTSEKRYQARLRERGISSKGAPDRGHSFQLMKHKLLLRPVDVHWSYRGNSITWENPTIIPWNNNSAFQARDIHRGVRLDPVPYQETGLDAFAQSAYSRVAPSPVIFDAANFLGELREGLPKLVPDILKGRANFFRSSGSDYLNVQFGWLPLVSDIQNAATALARATTQLAQQGERVHRKYSIPPTTRSGSVTWQDDPACSMGSTRGLLTSNHWQAIGQSPSSRTQLAFPGEHTLYKAARVHRWFEGEFSSFYPLGFDPTDYFHRLNQLMSVKLTPAVLWELSPWSWLVDWSLRIGDSIAANEMAANDLLVMHYGYAMEETVYKTTISSNHFQSGSFTSTSGMPRKRDIAAVTTHKRRLRANPYGFRVSQQSGLTGSQLGILAALGLSRTPR